MIWFLFFIFFSLYRGSFIHLGRWTSSQTIYFVGKRGHLSLMVTYLLTSTGINREFSLNQIGQTFYWFWKTQSSLGLMALSNFIMHNSEVQEDKRWKKYFIALKSVQTYLSRNVWIHLLNNNILSVQPILPTKLVSLHSQLVVSYSQPWIEPSILCRWAFLPHSLKDGTPLLCVLDLSGNDSTYLIFIFLNFSLSVALVALTLVAPQLWGSLKVLYWVGCNGQNLSCEVVCSRWPSLFSSSLFSCLFLVATSADSFMWICLFALLSSSSRIWGGYCYRLVKAPTVQVQLYDASEQLMVNMRYFMHSLHEVLYVSPQRFTFSLWNRK